jgi:flagellar biosynthesis/type III secretory pathway M-ring protein FliF/YscJ
MDDPTTDDNPLSVDEAMALIGKWETHPGLLLAVFDAARKLRDEVELLRDQLQQSQDWGNAVKMELETTKREIAQTKKFATELVEGLAEDKKSQQTELDQLRAVVAQNNQSIAAILSRWIKPSTN